jgi:heme-degrading monooxygenase HmoA
VIILPAAHRPEFFALNVFRVRPENQQPFIDCIRDAGDPAGIPGLLSMHLLRSADGTQVINHMHWADREAFDSAGAGGSVIDAARRAIRQHIEGAGPIRYDVVAIK